ncbi:MAG: hypothetical protein KF819_25265 [Labilithrix sp.]|nr:hypothetical protein [Labilithrix sp.]
MEHRLLAFKLLIVDPSGAGRAAAFLAAIRERFAGKHAGGADLSTPPSRFSINASSLRVHHMEIHAGQKVRDFFLEWKLYGADGELSGPEANALFLGAAGVLHLGPEDGSVERLSRDIGAIQRQLAVMPAAADEPPTVLGHDVILMVRSPTTPPPPLVAFGFPTVSEEDGALANLQSLQRAVLLGM